MSEAAVYDAYVEVGPTGACLAQLYDLPGCYARGRDQATALGNLEAAIPAFYAWLQAHDEYTPIVHGPYWVNVVGTAPVNTLDVHAPGALFDPAAVPMTEEDLDWYLALLDWAYTDLATLLDRTDAARADEIVTHVAQTQLWLISRLEPQPTVPPAEQLSSRSRDRLRQEWQTSLVRLRNTSGDERERITEHGGERWSLRKLLRRSILHVRMHTDELGQPPGM